MIKRVFAAATALLMASASAGAANDLAQLARDLERALGEGRVEVKRQSPEPRSPAPRHGTATRIAVTEVSLVEAMNRHRVSHGLSPLRLNSRLSLAAQDRIVDMFDKRYFAHVAPDGTQPFVWVSRRGYSYRTVGENLAVGYPSADRVVSGWMHSPGHRENILARGFDEIGIAVSAGAPLRGYGGPTVVAIYASR